MESLNFLTKIFIWKEHCGSFANRKGHKLLLILSSIPILWYNYYNLCFKASWIMAEAPQSANTPQLHTAILLLPLAYSKASAFRNSKWKYPTLRAIPAIYGGSALYIVVMQQVGWFPGKSIISLWAGKCYVFVRRSANVNLTQLDQNDLPRILLKATMWDLWTSSSPSLLTLLHYSNPITNSW